MTGDQADMQDRLYALLPRGWFPDLASAPILGAVLSGIGWMLAQVYSMLAYVKLQTRLATATEIWLDLISLDYFGDLLPRMPSETDNAFRARIQKELRKQYNTRGAIVAALKDLTGITPGFFIPSDTGDTGGYNLGGVGYCIAGGYGSLLMGFQGFVTAYRPITSFGDGYGNHQGGYGSGALAYAQMAQVSEVVTDAAIYAAVASVLPAATVAWVKITDSDYLATVLNVGPTL